jgi:hypothetical protein
MNWLTQKTGIINHYRENIHFGTQPIRVLNHMMTYMFQNTFPSFFEELKGEIDNGKVNSKLDLIHGRNSIKTPEGNLQTPRVNLDTKTIELHETFLSFLWCSTYSVYIQYLETIDFPRVNRLNGRIIYPVSQANIDEAKEIFNYGRSLIVDFQDWDKENLSNPEVYLAEKRNYVEQTSMYYTEAMKFILSHEYTHLKIHADQINEQTQISNYLAFEMEADNKAIDMLVAGYFPPEHFASEAQRLAITIGITIGILSMFFFRATTTGIKHPNAEDRLTNALERLNLPSYHEAWGIACIGLKIWDEQFGINLTWEDNPKSHMHQYYNIVEQIKQQNN